MSELTTLAKQIALIHLFSDGVEIGLTRDGPEIKDGGYARAPLTISSPFEFDNMEGMAITNINELRFGQWDSPAPEGVTGWIVLDSAGEILASGELQEHLRPRGGDELVIRPRSLVLGLK